MFRMIVVGKTVAELRESMFQFLKETDRITPEGIGQGQDLQDDADLDDDAPTQDFVTEAAKMPAYPLPVKPPVFDTAPPPPAPRLVPSIPIPSAPLSPPMSTPVSSNERDSRGVPWDERIHSATKAVNKDGSWRTRRGVEPSLVDTIEKQTLAVEVPQRVSVPVTPQQPIVTPPVVAVPAASRVEPAAKGPVSIAPIISAHTPQTFRENLVATLSRLVSEGKLTQAYIQSLKDYFQVEQIWQVSEAQSNEMFEQFCLNGLLVRA